MVQLVVTVAPLELGEVDLAYPLVALGDIPLSLEAWRTLAKDVLRRQAEGLACGVMTARRRHQI